VWEIKGKQPKTMTTETTFTREDKFHHTKKMREKQEADGRKEEAGPSSITSK
jgi:hypothetical protein